jgi:hypothetical protein
MEDWNDDYRECGSICGRVVSPSEGTIPSAERTEKRYQTFMT